MNDTGGLAQLDCSSVFYNLNNKSNVSLLTTSMLPNGVSLARILEAHELLISQLQQQLRTVQNQLSQS